MPSLVFMGLIAPNSIRSKTSPIVQHFAGPPLISLANLLLTSLLRVIRPCPILYCSSWLKKGHENPRNIYGRSHRESYEKCMLRLVRLSCEISVRVISKQCIFVDSTLPCCTPRVLSNLIQLIRPPMDQMSVEAFGALLWFFQFPCLMDERAKLNPSTFS